MSDHIPDPTKMISDTPRMQSALLDHPDAGFAKIWQVGCDIERELNAANERIKRLEEAGDETDGRIGCGCGCDGPCSDCRSASEKWNKAKESKP
jgi:hypothetical protein